MKIICDWNKCNEPGSYKAPVERDNSKKFRLLCLKHIKIFNKKWNYFENMNDREIEFFIKSDLTWHKATKSFGSSENFFNILWNNALEDKLNIFSSSNFKEYKKKLGINKIIGIDNNSYKSSSWTKRILVPSKGSGNVRAQFIHSIGSASPSL